MGDRFHPARRTMHLLDGSAALASDCVCWGQRVGGGGEGGGRHEQLRPAVGLTRVHSHGEKAKATGTDGLLARSVPTERMSNGLLRPEGGCAAAGTAREGTEQPHAADGEQVLVAAERVVQRDTGASPSSEPAAPMACAGFEQWRTRPQSPRRKAPLLSSRCVFMGKVIGGWSSRRPCPRAGELQTSS